MLLMDTFISKSRISNREELGISSLNQLVVIKGLSAAVALTSILTSLHFRPVMNVDERPI